MAAATLVVPMPPKAAAPAIATPCQQPTLVLARDDRRNTKIHVISVSAGSTLLFHSLNCAPELQRRVPMKTIGILAACPQLHQIYATLCRLTQQQLGGLHSPDLLIRYRSATIEALQTKGNWEVAGALLNREREHWRPEALNSCCWPLTPCTC